MVRVFDPWPYGLEVVRATALPLGLALACAWCPARVRALARGPDVGVRVLALVRGVGMASP